MSPPLLSELGQSPFVRMLPNAELPTYTYIPGTQTPHPIRDARGHSSGRKPSNLIPLVEENWADNRGYLWGLDLFNLGFYWEANEEWELVARHTPVDTLPNLFLRGLAKLAASGVKVREMSIHGVRRHAASAGELFADVAAETDGDGYAGLTFTELQFASDRAAQLLYKDELQAGRPLRVFPFLLIPHPLPLSEERLN